MKVLKIKWILGMVLIIIFFGVLLFLRFGNAFSPEKKIDGIEELGTSFEDFDIPKDVRVIGIGEGSHGNSEFQVAKMEVLQKVVNEGNGRAISFELSVGQGAMINDAIHENETDLTELVGELDYPLYDTQEIVDLLEYMREFNSGVPYEESIMFYGVDMQGGFRSIEYLQGLAEKGSELLTSDEAETILAMDAELDDLSPYRDSLEALYERLAAEDDLESQRLGVVVTAAIQYIDAPDYDGTTGDYGNFRDLSMAENLQSFSEIEEKREYSQIVITAHNGHVMKGSSMEGDSELKYPTMGENINQLFEGSYYVIGTEFYNGTVNIHTAGTYDDEYERLNHDFCSEDKLAYQAKFFDGGRYCLDFSKVTDEKSQVYKIIYGKNFTALVGEGYNLCNELEKGDRFKCVVADRYDAMIYYYEAAPIETIHY